MAAPSRRPHFLNLFQIRFPVGAVCSIGHRASGVILVAALPILVCLLERSLAGPEGFATVLTFLATMYGKAGMVLLAWALAHHALAGGRHMLKDLDVGATLATARRSAWLALVGGGLIALVTMGLVA